MNNNQNKNIESLLEQSVSYQRRIAKDLHSLYFLVIASIVLTVVCVIFVLNK